MHAFSPDRLRLILLVALLVGVPVIDTWAQNETTATLLVRESGTFRSARSITIAHTDGKGQAPPDTARVRAADQIHFRYVPAEDWDLERDDVTGIRLQQKGDSSTILTPSIVCVDPSEARVAIPKDTLDLTASIVFKSAVGISEPLSINEIYRAAYPRFRAAYDTAQTKQADGASLAVVRALQPFVAQDAVAQTFSFYPAARKLLDQAARAALDRESETLRRLRGHIQSPSREDLAAVDRFRARLDSVQGVLAPYLADSTAQRASARDQMNLLRDAAASMRENARASYRKETLRIFLRGNYENDQFTQSLALLVRLLTDPVTTTHDRTLDVDTLVLSRLEAPRYDSLRTELASYGALGDVQEVARLVNRNIQSHGYVFGEAVMQNLRLQRPGAPEPYYEILSALNAVGAGDQAALQSHLQRALAKCTDLTFLNALQQWRMAEHPSQQTVTDTVRTLLATAHVHARDGKLDAAKQHLLTASRRAGGYPPLAYARGDVARQQGNTDAALVHFEHAVELAPSYVVPRISAVRALIEAGRYERAVARADSVLNEYPYWTLYYQKARALMGLEQYEEARAVLRGRCEPLNNESIPLYLMLGEVYRAQEQWEGAHWAYENAEDLRPNDPRVATQLDAFRNELQAVGLTLDDVAPSEGDR